MMSNAQRESLFICSQSADPFSILLLDPVSGGSRWSYRGSELQGAKIHTAQLLGQQQTHLCVALADKPILISVPLRKQNRSGSNHGTFSTKSILNHAPQFITSHPSGHFLFVASDNKLYTWEVLNGQLLSILEEHVREISAMAISSCGNFLITASLDGAVKVFLTSSLVAKQQPDYNRMLSIGGHSSHSMSVNAVHVTGGGASPRVLSVSADHSACLFALATKQVLLRVTTDQPLNACCMDPAETRIFLGSESGKIRVVDIQSEFTSSYQRMNAGDQQFEHQNTPIRKLCVNMDGTRLASGDHTGSYCIWDVSNGQCLRSGKMQGPISSLAFLPNFLAKQQEYGIQSTSSSTAALTVNEDDFCPQVSTLQRQLLITRKTKVCTQRANGMMDSTEKGLQANFDGLLKSLNERALRGNILKEPKKVEAAQNNAFTKGKKRRLEDEEENTVATLPKTNGLPQQPAAAATTSASSSTTTSSAELEALKKRMIEMEREIARLVKVNTELYQFTVNLVLNEEGG